MPIGPSDGFAIDRLAVPGARGGRWGDGLIKAVNELGDALF
jgi:hypothetical protein